MICLSRFRFNSRQGSLRKAGFQLSSCFDSVSSDKFTCLTSAASHQLLFASVYLSRSTASTGITTKRQLVFGFGSWTKALLEAGLVLSCNEVEIPMTAFSIPA